MWTSVTTKTCMSFFFFSQAWTQTAKDKGHDPLPGPASLQKAVSGLIAKTGSRNLTDQFEMLQVNNFLFLLLTVHLKRGTGLLWN